MKLLLQLPTLGRPQKFLDCLNEYILTCSGEYEYVVNVNCDITDLTMSSDTNLELFDNVLGSAIEIKELKSFKINYYYDADTTKISAMNNLHGEDFDILVALSDDMYPSMNNWDKFIVEAMEEHFPDMDGCVHFDDGHAGESLITLSIMGKKLYDQFGYIYHPDYKSLYCDNEFTQVMKASGKYKYIDKNIISHEHYAEEGNRNSGDFDEAANKTLAYSGRDGLIFQKRQEMGFPQGRITND